MINFLLLGVPAAIVEGISIPCPAGTTAVDTFSAEGTQWAACEDLSTPGGGLTLVPESGPAIHLPKSHEPYSPEPDENYYLGLGKQAVLRAKWDMLGDAILHGCGDDSRTPTTGLCEPTWSRVERALPVMRYSQGNKQASGNRFMCSPYSPESGVRTFTGSRSASVDATFSDHADDCTVRVRVRVRVRCRVRATATATVTVTVTVRVANPNPNPNQDNGFPRPQGYVMNLTAIAHGEPPIDDFLQYVNFSAMAEGSLGGGDGYPNLVLPLLRVRVRVLALGLGLGVRVRVRARDRARVRVLAQLNPHPHPHPNRNQVFYFPLLRQNFTGFGGSRYWSMVASPVPDMQGGRQQSVWFRFQQLRCAGAHLAPPCRLHGAPQYSDTYWYTHSPITRRSI